VVGVACVLGFTTSLARLPGLGTQHEEVLPGFRGRALLSTADLSPIKASHIRGFVPVVRAVNTHRLAFCFAGVTLSSASLSLQAFTTRAMIGFSIGSVSSVLYLSSRLPQMHTNVSMSDWLLSFVLLSFADTYTNTNNTWLIQIGRLWFSA